MRWQGRVRGQEGMQGNGKLRPPTIRAQHLAAHQLHLAQWKHTPAPITVLEFFNCHAGQSQTAQGRTKRGQTLQGTHECGVGNKGKDTCQLWLQSGDDAASSE